jgi:four helix bundle protein
MSRDHRKLRVFLEADRAVDQVYQATSRFPEAERFGLQSQLRRAAVSVAANIVEGSARESESEYRHFLNIAVGSAAEVSYLLQLACRLGFLESDAAGPLGGQYDRVVSGLKALVRMLKP